jgi:hypothetical protein
MSYFSGVVVATISHPLVPPLKFNLSLMKSVGMIGILIEKPFI